jgi:predicted ATPase/DNA-binding SARP family transcriptional activator
VAARLWPNSDTATAQANLRRILNELRRVLGGASCLIRTPQPRTLRLDPDDVDVDVLAFDRLIARGDPASLERAVGLYRGPLLEGCQEEWALQERQVREMAYLNALERLANGAVADAELGLAVGYLRRVVATDPLREAAHRALMQALAAGGNHAAALVVYRDLRLLLHREVNAQPDPETHSLYHQIQADLARLNGVSRRRSSPSLAPSDQEPARSASSHNLPHPTTSFVGRERDMEAIPRLLKTTRLLTITGAGGCGKSRLALEVAHQLRCQTPDGAWSVELASLADPTLIPQAVRAVLGAQERPGEALTDTLVRLLRTKRLLLLLDNCEHLLSACAALIDALLRGCPDLRVLATSREPLSMLGETTYRIPSLPQSDAVRLFGDRAAAAQQEFDLVEHAESVARICRRLDGIPLAIEMAATRLRALPVGTLADRLEDSLRLLTDGNRVALPRHRTLRAMIDWSHGLLSEPEQVLLRRLALFAGGWTIAAAEAVCADFGVRELAPALLPTGGTVAAAGSRTSQSGGKPPHSKIGSEDVLDLLTKLVDKSLVLYESRGGEWRCRLLEPVRQFAQEHLAASGEEDGMRQRHAGYYLALAEEAEPQLTDPNPLPSLERLEREVDNLRAVLTWALERPGSTPEGDAVQVGLRLASAVCRFWVTRGYQVEGRDWLERLLPIALAHAPDRSQAAAICARALWAAASLAWWQGELKTARTRLEESLCFARETGDRELRANSLLLFGMIAGQMGEFEVARQRWEESLAIFRELDDQRAIATLSNNLSTIVREQGDCERAGSLLEESLRIHRQRGDRASARYPLAGLGILYLWQGDYPSALAYLQESLAISRELGDQGHIALVMNVQGILARYQGDLATASARHTEALQLHQAVGSRREVMRCLVDLGCAKVMRGESTARSGAGAARQFAHGARLFSAAEALRQATGAVIWCYDRADHERCMTVARAALGEAAFAAAWAEGQALSLDQACALALAEERTENLTTVCPSKSP